MINNVPLIALQGSVEVDFDTETKEFTKQDIVDSIYYAKELKKTKDFSLYDEAIKTILILNNLTEYDKFRDEILSELYTDVTAIGVTSDKINSSFSQSYALAYSNKLGMSNDMALTKTHANTNSQVPKMGIKPKMK